MQSVSSRIWTGVAVSISYDDNHYTTGTFNLVYVWQLIDKISKQKLKTIYLKIILTI